MNTPPSSHTPQYYRERAAECERLAKEALSPVTRETMLYLAMRWRAIADHDLIPKPRRDS